MPVPRQEYPIYKADSSPASGAFAVTPSDSTAIVADALYVGTGGNVSVETSGGDSVEFANVVAGTILPISVVKVKAATTASDIVGMTF